MKTTLEIVISAHNRTTARNVVIARQATLAEAMMEKILAKGRKNLESARALRAAQARVTPPQNK